MSPPEKTEDLEPQGRHSRVKNPNGYDRWGGEQRHRGPSALGMRMLQQLMPDSVNLKVLQPPACQSSEEAAPRTRHQNPYSQRRDCPTTRGVTHGSPKLRYPCHEPKIEPINLALKPQKSRFTIVKPTFLDLKRLCTKPVILCIENGVAPAVSPSRRQAEGASPPTEGTEARWRYRADRRGGEA